MQRILQSPLLLYLSHPKTLCTFASGKYYITILHISMDSLLVDSAAFVAVQDTLTYVSQDSIVSLLHTLIENTAPDPTPRLGIQMYQWNFWIPIIALIAGLIGTYYGWKGYFFSKKTAENVARLSPDAQYALCRNFAVQLYKNIVRIMVLKYKLKHNKDSITQNEIIALHLPKFEDVFFVDAYYKDAKIFMAMQKMKEDMQTYFDQIDNFGKTHSEEDLQKLLNQTINLLTQTKDIAQFIPRKTNGDNTYKWTTWDATFNAIKDMKQSGVFKKWIWVAGGWGAICQFIIYMMNYDYEHWLSYVCIDGLYIIAWFPIGIVFAYILFRKHVNYFYNWKRRHKFLFFLLSMILVVLPFGIIRVFSDAIKCLLPNNSGVIVGVIGLLLLLMLYVWFGKIIIKLLKKAKEKRTNNNMIKQSYWGSIMSAISDISTFNKPSSIQQLLSTSNSMLDFYISFLMQHHTHQMLDNKDKDVRERANITLDVYDMTQERQSMSILNLIQYIHCEPVCPNPIIENYDIVTYKLTTQDIEEFKHLGEDTHLPVQYREILKKEYWTTNNLETLFAYMISIDAACEINK